MATNHSSTVDEPLAVVGMSFRMPQGVVDDSSFWEVLENRKNLSTMWPEERLGITVESGLGAGEAKKPMVNVPGAHFIKEDLAEFDAPFFSITAKEAAAMDPQQRWALEVAYHAFENAGMPVESLRGSRTAVFATTFSDDYSRMTAGDDDAPPHSATGNSRSIFANRISWHFDLRGPSVFVDTACSASITALEFACQVIKNGDASSALVLASNMMLSPEMSVAISKLGILSPNGRCFSFDARGDGYSRGEGVIAMVIKPIDAALRDGDTIRAVIRGTGTNQDGRTPILTQPSALAQEALIRHVYAKAGLGFEDTRYFEAHGTGTPTGDPIEMSAIGKVFRSHRSRGEPLFVGSVKSNIGHLEGASGLAGVAKAILALEKGVIPPTALFETINPGIDADKLNVQVPIQCVPWPQQGLRRISVNSFGFGGSNAHVILDDASNYLESQGLTGYHHCHPVSVRNGITNGTHTTTNIHNGIPANPGLPRLLVWSASDSNTLGRLVGSYQDYFHVKIAGRSDRLSQLAYTLAARRSVMAWRTFAVVDDSFDADVNSDERQGTSLAFPTEPLIRASVSPDGHDGIVFVFTGQGAQYAGMGLELVRYPVFEQSLRRSDEILASLGCAWSVFDQLSDLERINRPEFSQPLCTILQIALVQLLRSFGITPAAVVGHSSGEIAAGYSIGALSHSSAVKVAYFRGQVAKKLVDASQANPGAMLAANLTPAQVPEYLQQFPSVQIACFNSPNNVTVSGPLAAIDALKKLFDQQGVFARVLNTGIAYHSSAMQSAVDEYRSLMGSLEAPGHDGRDEQPTEASPTIMISSVTGALVATKLLVTPQYWIDNLVSPVRFSQAIQHLLSADSESSLALPLGIKNLTDLVEIGPHSALKWSLTDTLDAIPSSSLRYHSVLERNKSPLSTALSVLGRLFCLGHSTVSILEGNGQARGEVQGLIDCPPYPFDHSRRYWTESRMSKDNWYRVASPGYLLGKRSHDWNPLRPRWKTWLSVEGLPWLADHVVNGTTVCPATGMLVMAIEAILQHHDAAVPTGILIKTAEFLAPMHVGETRQDATETELHLNPVQESREGPGASSNFDVCIFAYHANHWTECFRASVQVQFDQTNVNQVDGGRERRLKDEQIRDQVEDIFKSSSARPIDSPAFYKFCAESGGLKYGETFQQLRDLGWDGDGKSAARIPLSELPPALVSADSPVHPALFDAALHLGIVQLSRGLTEATPTLVPHRLTNLWISTRPWGAETSSLRLSAVLQRAERGALGSLKVITDGGKPLCWIEKLTWAEVSKASNTSIAGGDETLENALLYRIEWTPQLSSLSPRQLQQICDESVRSVHNTISWSQMEYAMRLAVRRVLDSVSDSDLEGRPDHMVRYVTTMRRQYGSPQQDEAGRRTLDSSEIEALLHECETKQPAWRIFSSVLCSLRAIIRGEEDPLELLFTTNEAVKTFYSWVFEAHMADGRFLRFLDLASHEKPGMRILEIGAGTGGMTRHVLAQLQEFERATGQMRFIEYVYTDISPVFFDAARREFASCKDRMSFRTLDMEREPASQGFELGYFDIVVAASVLHVTSDITASLNRVRSLLKPGGRLVLQETIRPDSACVNVTFGSLEQWWMSKEAWRQDSPLVTEQRWDEVMRLTGFTGIDLLLRDDGDDEESRFSSIMVSTATDGSSTSAQGYGACQPVLLLVDPASGSRDLQQATASEIMDRCPSAKVVGLEDFTTTMASISANKTIVISLVELAGSPYLGSLSEASFDQLKELMLSTENMIWVASGHSEPPVGGHNMHLPFDPHMGLSQGLLRSVRNEDNSKHLVSLLIDSDATTKYSPTDAAQLVVKVLESCFLDDVKSPEVEFIGRNGQLSIGRMVHDMDLEKQRVARRKPQLRMENWHSGGPSVVLEMGTPGMLDTMRFAEDVIAQQDLGCDEIEVKALACPISSDDVSIALGRVEGQKMMGLMCAGIVTRTGSACSNSQVRAGDSVVMVTQGCMGSYPRAKSDSVFKIPDGITVHDAVAIITPGATAYHSLVNIARLQEGEAVLIHSAATAIGQMAVTIARMMGGEVFVTVSSEEKKQLLIERFDIADDHIFFSGDASFAQGVMRQTSGRGVDVVLNSLSAAGLQAASWECLAPYGRFVEISGKADKNSPGLAMAMSGNLKNVTFAAVDFQHIVMNNSKLTRRLVDTILDLVSRGQVHAPFPLQVYPVSETEKAFRHLQGGNNVGSTIVSMGDDDVVPKFMRLKSTWYFDADASYLVAGGLGGIGRVLLSWMVDRGAKHLIVPSRSGASSKAARDLISELTSKGVTLMAPCCDVSSKPQVEQMLEECQAQKMPPIKGCINGAMVLQDSIFENMTHAQWSTTIHSKVDATWNLHQLLPDNLDFFVMLSSLSGIQGTMGQSNYVAGCTFQDALAHARTAAGYRNTISLDLGWVRPVGDMTEHNANSILKIIPIEMPDLIAVMEHCCDPSSVPSIAHDLSPGHIHWQRSSGSQLLVGVTLHAHYLDRGMIPPPMLDAPMFTGFVKVRFNRGNNLMDQGGDSGRKNFALLFAQAEGGEREGIVVSAIQEKISEAHGITPDDVDVRKSLSEYGVDSLMAVELRNWMRKDFGASVAVFEMMNAGRSIKSVAGLVAEGAERGEDASS